MVGAGLSLLVFPRELGLLTAGLLAGGGVFAAVRAGEAWVCTAARLAGLLLLAGGAGMAFGGLTGAQEGAPAFAGWLLLAGAGAVLVSHLRSHPTTSSGAGPLPELDLNRLAAIVESSPNMMAFATLEGRVVYMNPAGRRIVALGDDYRERNTSIRDFFDSTTLPLLEDELLPSVFSTGVWTGDYQLRHFETGEHLDFAGHVFQVTDPATSRPYALANVSIDMRERRIVEAALRETERRFQDIAGNIRDVFWIMSGDLQQMLYVSPAFEQIWGLTGAALVADPRLWLASVHRDDQERVEHAFQRMASGRTFDTEYRIIRPDGHERWIHDRGFPAREESGRIGRFVGVAEDITDRKAIEAAMRQSEQTSRSLLDAYPSVAFLMEPDGSLIAANEALVRQLGLPEDYVGRKVWDFLPPAVASRRSLIGREIAESRRPVHFVDQRAGRTMDNQVVPLFDEQGNVARLAVFSQDTTEQVRAAEALRESESFLRQAQAIAHLGHWILNLETGALTWSDEIYRIFEIDPERFGATYEAFLNAIHPGDRAMVDDAYTKSVADRTEYGIVHRLLMPDGRIKYVHEQGQTDYNDDGTPRRSIGTVHDITEFHRVEEALRQSEETFRTLAETAPALIWIGRDETTFFVNDAVVALTGYPREELLAPGGFFPRTIHPEERDAVATRGLARLRGEPVPGRYELRMVTASGDVRWLDFSGGVVSYDGEPANLGVAVDITERKRSEEALRDSEERLRAIFDAEPECVKLLDLDGRLIGMNRAGLEMIEAGSLDQVLGASVCDLVLPEFQKAFADLNRRAAGGEPGILEFEMEGLKGTRRWLETHATVLRGTGGAPSAVLGVTRDITGRKAAERRILSALQEKETLLKEVHHRVKNNLAIVVELLGIQRHRQVDEGSRAALLESESRIYAMALVHEMLYQSTDLASIDLRDHVDRLCQQLLQSYERHGASVRLNTRVEDTNLPLDRAIPFSLVLNELVSNALKHAFPGDRPGVIDVSVGPAGKGATFLEVRDDGVGMDPSVDFESSRTLGLRLVSSLARQLGATVEVSRDRGTTIRLAFQAERPEVKKT